MVPLGLGALLVAGQALRWPPTNPAEAGGPVAPPAVQETLQRACYDCHSNATRWPWYSTVAPVSWLLQRDVMEGRRRLNFSEWADYASDPNTESQKLRDIVTRISAGDMAPWYYRLLHPSASLSDADRTQLASWAADEARHAATAN